MFDVDTNSSTLFRAPNFIQNTDILITIGDSVECRKQMTCVQSLTTTSKVGFQTMFFISTLFYLLRKKSKIRVLVDIKITLTLKIQESKYLAYYLTFSKMLT